MLGVNGQNYTPFSQTSTWGGCLLCKQEDFNLQLHPLSTCVSIAILAKSRKSILSNNASCQAGFKLLIKNKFISSLLSVKYLPKAEDRSGSGRGHQAGDASETQSGGIPRSARLPDDTTTPASAPIYIPEHPGGAKESDSSFRLKHRPTFRIRVSFPSD